MRRTSYTSEKFNQQGEFEAARLKEQKARQPITPAEALAVCLNTSENMPG